MLSKLTKLSEEYNVWSFPLKVEYSPRIDTCIPDISATNEPSPMWAECSILPLRLLNSLKKLADPGATMTFVVGGALKPIGGHILSHASTTRLFLRKGTMSKDLNGELPWLNVTSGK